MKSILIIHIWLGKLPNYFDFWRQSCLNNPTVDFLLCTDQDVAPSANFKVYKTDLDDLRSRAAGVLGFQPALSNPRKLCDYKGLFGLMLPEYTEGYDFWGFCDCDLIFGDIRHFFTESLLDRYHYILCLGHLHIQRVDDPDYLEAFKAATGIGKVGYWEAGFDPAAFKADVGPSMTEVFTTERNHIFDEMPYGAAAKYYELYPDRFYSGFGSDGRCFDEPYEIYNNFRDIYNNLSLYKRSYYSTLATLFPFWKRDVSADCKYQSGTVYLYDGKLYRVYLKGRSIVKEEILYVHFIHRRMAVKTSDMNDYLIIPNAFVRRRPISRLKLLLYNMRFDHKLYIYTGKVKRRLSRFFRLSQALSFFGNQVNLADNG